MGRRVSILPLIWQYGIGAAVIAALLAVAFLTTFKKTSLAIAGGVALWLAAYTIGVNDGKDLMQAKWDRAEKAALDAAVRARHDAELAVPAADPDEHTLVGNPPTPGPRPCVVPDKFNRDCG